MKADRATQSDGGTPMADASRGEDPRRRRGRTEAHMFRELNDGIGKDEPLRFEQLSEQRYPLLHQRLEHEAEQRGVDAEEVVHVRLQPGGDLDEAVSSKPERD